MTGKYLLIIIPHFAFDHSIITQLPKIQNLIMGLKNLIWCFVALAGFLCFVDCFPAQPFVNTGIRSDVIVTQWTPNGKGGINEEDQPGWMVMLYQ